MATIIADNITSPLGMTSAENLAQIYAGRSALSRYESKWGLPDPFFASLFTNEQITSLSKEGCSFFESVAIHSISEALSQVRHDVLSMRTILIVSTTKANIELIGRTNTDTFLPSVAAKHIVETLNLKEEPIVVCNACASGVAAIILAERLLKNGDYDNVIVCGCDVLGKFIVSGFQSLKALSPEECRPFDIERLGLNLGEAAATIILSDKVTETKWRIEGGAIRNDASHITNPSPKGIGCADALVTALGDTAVKDIAMVNLHGTATMYNDQMESKAVETAGLSAIPANGLKGYFGHTMGASGVLETIVSMHAVENHIIPSTRGFYEMGVSGNISISKDERHTEKKTFLKVISGFGGCNAAIKVGQTSSNTDVAYCNSTYNTGDSVEITPCDIYVNGKRLDTEGRGKDMLRYTYKRYVDDYPKYFKMDLLCQIGFVATELLLQTEGQERFRDRKDRAVVLFNASSSYVSDFEYQRSISSVEGFYPSPSAFIYTLPNIVTGEIAIRNKFHSETSFFILGHKDEEIMTKILCSTFEDREINSILTGWINAYDNNNFEAEIKLIYRNGKDNYRVKGRDY